MSCATGVSRWANRTPVALLTMDLTERTRDLCKKCAKAEVIIEHDDIIQIAAL